jgi:hypothetical protein
MSLKFIDAKQAKEIYQYKNIQNEKDYLSVITDNHQHRQVSRNIAFSYITPP